MYSEPLCRPIISDTCWDLVKGGKKKTLGSCLEAKTTDTTSGTYSWATIYLYFLYFADCASQYIFLNINQLDALNFIMSLLHASTCFEHHVLIVRRSKLYYTASGIITPIGGHPLHRLREDNFDLLTMSTCARNM